MYFLYPFSKLNRLLVAHELEICFSLVIGSLFSCFLAVIASHFSMSGFKLFYLPAAICILLILPTLVIILEIDYHKGFRVSASGGVYKIKN